MIKQVLKISFVAVLTLAMTSCKCDKNAENSSAVGDAAAGVAAAGAGAAAAVGAVAEGTLDAAGNFVRKVGDLFDITLPSGLKLNIAKDSAEDQLYTQLSGDFTVNTEDKTQGWLNLNGVFFNSGSAELTAESSKQVKNIAAILKEYPAANIKVGGYTDNTGDAAGNKTLSAQRAEAVAKLLVAEGVPAASVASEGYGSEHPECPANDTDICKAQNRRVALRLTAK